MDIKLVRQEAPMGCELSCFAMLTGRTYQEARDFIAEFEHFRADDQLPTCHYMQLLYDHGYYKRREYGKSFGTPRKATRLMRAARKRKLPLGVGGIRTVHLSDSGAGMSGTKRTILTNPWNRREKSPILTRKLDV